ncbi:MAG: lipid A-modifier LpxR family protein, partial [Psychromonas sp.]
MLKNIAQRSLGWILYQVTIASLILITVLLSFSTSAEDFNSGNISLTIDNDSLTGTDREYSSGVFLKFNSSSEVDINQLEPLPIKYIASILPLYDKTQKNWGVTLGQKMWTPSDIEIEEEVSSERPYSGLLFAEVHLSEYSSSIVN